MTSLAQDLHVRLTRPRGGTRILRGRVLQVCVLSFPLWWALGLQNFMWPVVATPLFFSLLVRREAVRVPPRFGIWLLFLAWMFLSVVQVDNQNHAASYVYRGLLYLSATVLFLYIYNATESELPTRTIVNTLAAYWGIIVLGGLAAVLDPNFSFTAPAAKVLPHFVTHISFVQAQLHPGFAQVQRILGFPVGRPKTFFIYTNEWGANFTILTPFAFAALAYARTALRKQVIVALMVLSIIPLIFSLNRGAWLALTIGLVYSGVRFAMRGQVRILVWVIAVAAIGGVLILGTPLGTLMSERFAHPHSDKGRLNRDHEAIQWIKKSPVLGYGTPREAPEDPTGPSLGTHGQFFLVLFSQGLPGVALFLGWIGYTIVRSGRLGRAGPTARYWAHLAIILGVMQGFYYELLPMQLHMMMIAAALAYRDLKPAPEPEQPWVPAVVEPPAVERPRRVPRAPLPEPAEPDPGHAERLEAIAAAKSAALAEGAVQAKDDLVSVARGGSLNILGGITFTFFAFIFAVILTRTLHATGSGVFFVAIALFTVVTTIGQAGADVGLVRFLPRSIELGRTQDLRPTIKVALFPVLAFASTVAIGMIVFAPELSHALVHGVNRDAAVPYIHAIAPFLPLACFSVVALAGTRGLGTMLPFTTVRNIGEAALRPAFAIVVVLAGLSTVWFALGWGIASALSATAAAIWLLKLLRRAEQTDPEALTRPHTRYRRLAADFWTFSGARGMAQVFQIGVVWMDTLLLGALASSRDAGIYTAASRYVTVGNFALQAIVLAIGPQLSAMLTRRDYNRAKAVYQSATCWLMVPAWPVYIGLAIFSPFLLSLFGKDFESGQTALTILACAMLFNMATGPVTVVLLMSGKSLWNLLNTMTSLTVNVTLNVLLIPKYGMTGAAIAWTASIIVNNVLPIIEIWVFMRLHPLSIGSPIVALSAVACYGGFGVLIRHFVGLNLGTLLVWAIVSSACYAFLLWRFREPLHLGIFREALGPRGIGRRTVPQES
jgi:O-antigen/teichoic acid export membrane protein